MVGAGGIEVSQTGNPSLCFALETADGSCFCIVDIEYGHQLGDLQHFLELAAEITQTQRYALVLCAKVPSDKCAQARAVDILNLVHIQYDFLLSLGDQALQFLTQRIAL